jgi:FkbM family methyltransferase
VLASFFHRDSSGCFPSLLPDRPIILELGSRDALDAIGVQNAFPGSKVFSFDCNPAALQRMHENLRRSCIPEDKIEIVPLAVNDFSGENTLYPTGGDNIGASALSPLNKTEPLAQWHTDSVTALEPIGVQSVALKDWATSRGIDRVDMLLMDLQGWELRALKGLGPKLLSKVRVIVTEGQWVKLYDDSDLIHSVADYVEQGGFKALDECVKNRATNPNGDEGRSFGDYTFVNPALVPKQAQLALADNITALPTR